MIGKDIVAQGPDIILEAASTAALCRAQCSTLLPVVLVKATSIPTTSDDRTLTVILFSFHLEMKIPENPEIQQSPSF